MQLQYLSIPAIAVVLSGCGGDGPSGNEVTTSTTTPSSSDHIGSCSQALSVSVMANPIACVAVSGDIDPGCCSAIDAINPHTIDEPTREPMPTPDPKQLCDSCTADVNTLPDDIAVVIQQQCATPKRSTPTWHQMLSIMMPGETVSVAASANSCKKSSNSCEWYRQNSTMKTDARLVIEQLSEQECCQGISNALDWAADQGEGLADYVEDPSKLPSDVIQGICSGCAETKNTYLSLALPKLCDGNITASKLMV